MTGSLDKFYSLLIPNLRSHIISIEQSGYLLYSLRSRMMNEGIISNSIGKIVKIDDFLEIILLLCPFVYSFDTISNFDIIAYKIYKNNKKKYVHATFNVMAHAV